MKYFNFKFLLFFAALALAIPNAWAVTDVITSSDLAATSTTLAYFTGVSKPSGAVYAGRTAKHSSGAIILTTKTANSGIVSTTSGGKIKSVTFTFNSNTDKYGIEVYGKNTAYNSSADLTDESTRGDLLGTTNSLSTVITVSGDYEYVGIITNNTSTSNKILLDNIQIEWEAVNADPTLVADPTSLTIDDSGSNNTFTVRGSALGTDNVGVTPNNGFATTTTDQWWGFNNNNGSVNGTVTVTYEGRDLSASGSVNVANDKISTTVDVTYVTNLYIVGNYGNSGWDFTAEGAKAMAHNDGTYTATLEDVAANSYILFTRKAGVTYYWENDNNRLYIGAQTDGGDWTYSANSSGRLDTDPTNDSPVKYHPIYFPEAGTYTITIDADAGMFTITKYVQPDYEVTVSPDGGTIDFGNVNYVTNGTTVRTIYVKNTGLQPVTPTLSALSAPFTTDYTATELQSGESVTIYITFAPTEETAYNGTATLSFGNSELADRVFSLTGQGVKYGENDHSAIYDMTYEWVDDNEVPHVSNLLETATDPNQIIAMLRKIYMTPEIPGNKLRGYTEAGAVESLMVNGNDAFKVNYSAVGQLNSSREYTDTYGWNIPTEKSILNTTKGSTTYYYMDPTEYEPNEEGLTLIMIEIKDGANYSGSNYYSFTNSTLKEKVANTFKSARIITTYKKSGSGEEAGTLFKIDADKLNRFFFLAKGQLRLVDHSQAYENTWTSSNVVPFPSLKGGTFTDNTFNSSSGSAVLAPFEHMFEEFSPNQASTATNAMTDVYQDLVNMASFEVVHDCVSIPFVGGNHEFNMYGVESTSEDCQDVRDMMFFVPDYRMKFWRESQYSFGDDIRDPNSIEKFVNYNKDHRPTLGLYVIRQNEITGEDKGNNTYDLHLSWESNLLDFLPGAEGQYKLYRVITDADGNKTYQLVADNLDPNQTTYTDNVPMEEHGQQVTYVVQGQDKTEFLSLQMSNEESYIIPGTDKSELLTLSPKFDHYSRFDPETECNYYANQLKVVNNVGTNVKGKYMGDGAVFTFYRIPNNDNDSKMPIATATSNGNGTLTIAMQNQNREGKYTRKGLDWIKMNNPSTVAYTTAADGTVTFQGFTLYDNFCESVIGNEHPGMYAYQVEFTASQNIDDTESNTAHSNKIAVMIHKTAIEVESYTQDQVDDDVKHTLEIPVRTTDVDVKYSSKTEILRYDNYRWNGGSDGSSYPEEKAILDFEDSAFDPATGEVDEQDIAPTGIAGNQATYYSVSMNNEAIGRVNVQQDMTNVAKARFEDTYATQNWGLYTYAPVVETFTTRGDYNTYGAELAETGVATLDVEVGDYIMSSKGYNAVWEQDGKKYCHYTVTLKVNPLNMPEDYDLYMVRAWRKVNPALLSEQQFSNDVDPTGKLNRDYRLTEDGEYMMEEVYFTDFNKLNYTNRQLGYSNIEKGSPMTNEVRATFGAQKLASTAGEAGCITELPMSFIVRAYYTRMANLSSQTANGPRHIDSRDKKDEKFFIAEATEEFTFTYDDQHTGLNSVITDRQVTSVTYYNMMGQTSNNPFDGVNIKVTRYNDGTSSTTKVIK